MIKTLVVLSMMQGNLNIAPSLREMEHQFVGYGCTDMYVFRTIYHYPYIYPISLFNLGH